MLTHDTPDSAFQAAISGAKPKPFDPSAPIELVPLPANPHPVDLGMGFNWFDHLGVGGCYARWDKYPLDEQIYPDLTDTQSWKAIEQGLNEVGADWIRFGMPPDPHIDEKGKLITNTVHIERLIWLDKWATKNGKTLLLDFFSMPHYVEFPVPSGTQPKGGAIVNMAAENNRDFAQKFVAPLLAYLVQDLKLESLRYFNPINEPMEYGVYQTPDNQPTAIVHYVDMYRELRAALDAIGIDRNRIGLVGLDVTEPIRLLLEQHAHGVDIDPYLEAYSVHHYNLRLDHLPPLNRPDTGKQYFHLGLAGSIEREDKQVLAYTRARNKPLWALEMGTFYYGKWSNPAGVATLDATLTVAEGIIRALNTGLTAFCIWSLMNPNNVDGEWAVMGIEEGELVRKGYTFAVYSLLGTHIPAGATVTPLFDSSNREILHVHAVALESTEEIRTLLLVNDHASHSLEVHLTLPEGWNPEGKFETRLVDVHHLNVPLDHHLCQAGSLEISMPPFSITGLRLIS